MQVKRYRTQQPVAFDEFGVEIFGYNEKGQPVCYADREKGRCMSRERCTNGRCPKHGGATQKGFNHPQVRAKLFLEKLPPNFGHLLKQALTDEDYISLRTEIGVNTVQIVRLLESFHSSNGADGQTWKEIKALAERLEKLLFDTGVQTFITKMGGEGHGITQMANIAEQLVLLVKRGANEHKLFKEINEATEYRRRLVETELKREQISRHNIPAEQALQMFKAFTNIVKDIFGKYPIEMRMFAKALDQFSLDVVMETGVNVLASKMSPGSFVEPNSQYSNEIRESLPDPDVITIEDEGDRNTGFSIAITTEFDEVKNLGSDVDLGDVSRTVYHNMEEGVPYKRKIKI